MDDWATAVPKKDWVDGRSAKRLAETWWPARGFPARVLSALSAVEDLRGLVPVRGLIEHRTDVPGRGAGSATDLLVHARSATGVVVLAVEAKVDEGFDKTIRAWRLAGASQAAANNRDQRYKSMCDALKIASAQVLDARYRPKAARSSKATGGTH